ncbi:MAG: DUF3618 domain-containing protein [Solirubrobacteraceae bacterium]
MDEDQGKAGEELAGEERTPEQVREEIEQTRSELGDTVAALAEKTDVKAQAKNAAQEAKQTVTGKVTDIKESVTGKKDEFISSAQEATPESAQDAGQRALAFAKANSLPLAVVGALLLGVAIGRRGA